MFPLRSRDEPLKSEPWTWLWGETNPRSQLADKAVEGVRNAEDGKAVGVGACRNDAGW